MLLVFDNLPIWIIGGLERLSSTVIYISSPNDMRKSILVLPTLRNI